MSIRYKEKTIRVVDKVLCDTCGTKCSLEYCEIEAPFDDGYALHLCEACFGKMLEWMRGFRNPSIVSSQNDPLKGSGENFHLRFR